MKKIGIAIGILAILVIGGFVIQSAQQDNDNPPSDNATTGESAAPASASQPST